MSIIAFQTFQNDFNVERDSIEQALNKSFKWGDVPSDKLSLSSALNNQCKLNLNNLDSYVNLCNISYRDGFKKQDTVCRKSCKKLTKCYSDYMDVLSRDHDIFNNLVSQMPYALVLLDSENNYCGHIYVWIYKKKVYCMGIRNNVKSIFSKSSLSNISAYLLEGVRRFALHFGFKEFNVISPLEKMMNMLITKFNFEISYINQFGSYIFNPLISPDIVMKSGDIRRKKFVEEIYFGLALE